MTVRRKGRDHPLGIVHRRSSTTGARYERSVTLSSNRPAAANPTMTKFGYPETLVRDYAHWAVLLRPQQATLGALVLACKDAAYAFGDISAEAFAQLQQVTRDLPAGLSAFRPYQKIHSLVPSIVHRPGHFHTFP